MPCAFHNFIRVSHTKLLDFASSMFSSTSSMELGKNLQKKSYETEIIAESEAGGNPKTNMVAMMVPIPTIRWLSIGFFTIH